MDESQGAKFASKTHTCKQRHVALGLPVNRLPGTTVTVFISENAHNDMHQAQHMIARQHFKIIIIIIINLLKRQQRQI